MLRRAKQRIKESHTPNLNKLFIVESPCTSGVTADVVVAYRFIALELFEKNKL